MRCIQPMAVVVLAYLLCVPVCVDAENHELSLDGHERFGSIEGTLLMLDDSTPHVAVVVEAVMSTPDNQEGLVVVATLSDESGRYHLVDLEPGQYRVRCYIGQHCYYGQSPNALRGIPLRLEQGTALEGIDFRFPPFKKGTWRHYTHLDGLPHNTITRILLGGHGYMWFGTEVGSISRFDGATFHNLTHAEHGFPRGSVWSMYQDPDGAMWFGFSPGGVCRYDGTQFTPFGQESLGHLFVILWMKHDSQGAFWFGTYQGLYRYAEETFTHFTIRDGLAGNTVSAMHETADGALWFLTENDASHYDGSVFVNYTLEETFVTHTEAFANLDNDPSMNLHRASDGSLWYAPRLFPGFEPYVMTVQRDQSLRFPIRNPQSYNRVMGIQSTSDGAVWYGTRGEGLSRYDGQGFIHFTSQDGLLSDAVQHLVVDTDGVLWVGSGSVIEVYDRGGLSRYDPHTFVNFTTRDGLPSNAVSDLLLSDDGMLWVSTLDGGVSRYNGSELVSFEVGDGLVSNAITTMQMGTTGVLWLGTGGVYLAGKGVSRYDTRQERFLKPLTVEDGLASNTVYDIYAAPDGVVWLATEAGLSRYDPRTGMFLETLTTANGLADNTVVGLVCDPSERMWISSSPSYVQLLQGVGHVTCYDGMTSVHYDLASAEGIVRLMEAFCPPAGKVIWFMRGRYDGKTPVWYDQTEGLGDSLVRITYPELQPMAPDGLVWMGTDTKGVLLYDGTAWSSLDTRDGLAGNTVTAIAEDSDGSLWFGTKDGGLTHYRRTSSRPKVLITSVTTDRPYDDLMSLPGFSTGTRLTITYNAIDTKTIPQKRQYRLRITHEGDAVSDYQPPTQATSFDWVPDKAGGYTFEVQAIDRDLNYSEPASIVLTVVSPFYLRAAFLVPTVGGGGVLIIVSVVLAVVAVRRRRQVHTYELLAVQELQDARAMQMALMPQQAPTIQGAEVAGKCVTANTVGGDFFSYLSGSHPNEIRLLVADVSGKAMRGAMNAVMTDGIIHAALAEHSDVSPASLLQILNDVLTFRMESDMNVTMVIGLLDTAARMLTLANAAHHAHPLLVRDGEVMPLKARGLPLGMRAGIEYREESFGLQPGDILVLMTDGIIEAHDSEGSMYGDSDRLERALLGFTPEMSAEAMVDALIEDTIAFGGTERDDDMTVVVAKVDA